MSIIDVDRFHTYHLHQIFSGFEEVQFGMDCPSYNIPSTTTKSWEECAEECKHNKACVAIVLDGANTTCWQKYKCDNPTTNVLRKIYKKREQIP